MSDVFSLFLFLPRQFVEGDFEEHLRKLQDPQVRQGRIRRSAPAAPPAGAPVRSLRLWFLFFFFQQWVGEVEINALANMYK